MKLNEEKINEWIKKYYRLVYQYAYHVCKSSLLAERVAEQTFLKAYEYLQNKRQIDNPDTWFIQAARYYILREVYGSWKRGDDVEEKYKFPEPVNIEKIQTIMTRYEEKDANDRK